MPKQQPEPRNITATYKGARRVFGDLTLVDGATVQLNASEVASINADAALKSAFTFAAVKPADAKP